MSVDAKTLAVVDLEFSWPESQKKMFVGQLSLGETKSLFVHGPSGSGKSTLLYLLSGFLRPHKGSIEWFSKSLSTMSETQMNRFRSDSMGFVFQSFQLLHFLSPIENVMASARISNERARRARDRSGDLRSEAEFLFSKLKLDFKKDFSRPLESLSEGEKQRLALARALFGSPKCIFADEPTSSLDPQNRDLFMDLLIGESKRIGANVVFVSHDFSLMRHFDHSLDIKEILQND
jgi:putative ABC transport system ATP-binding protein